MLATDLSAPTPSLKEQGNDAFRASSWARSVALYTEALSEPSSLTLDDSAALFSNRAAAYIHLFQFDRDTLATTHSDSPSSLLRYSSASTLLSTRAAALHQAKLTPPEINFGKRIASLEAAGETDFIVGGSVELVLRSWEWVESSMKQIDEDVSRDQEGFRGKVPSGILGLADAILTDPRGFHIPPGKDKSCPLGEKLPLQYQYDIQVFAHEKFLMGGMSAEAIVREFDGRRKREGWTKPRTALAHLIRGQVLMAFVEEATGAYPSSTLKYRYALALLEAGAVLWKDVPDADRGTTFRPTFARGVRVALMLALEEGWSRAPSDEERELFNLDEVMSLAEGIMDDCIANPTVPDPSNATHWLAAQIFPLVHSAKALAFVLSHRAALSSIAGVHHHHPGMSGAASKMYAQAAVYLPLDDPDRPICLWLSLSSALRAGGLRVSQVFEIAAEAEAACPASEAVFGPVPRDFPDRLFVRRVCDRLREYVEKDGAGVLEHTVAAVPTSEGGDEVVQLAE